MKNLGARKKNPYRFYVYGFFVIILMAIMLNNLDIKLPSSPFNGNVLGITTTTKPSAHISPLSAAPISQSLKDAALEPLQDSTGTYSIVVKNLKTGELFYQDEHRHFDSASLYKLWVMATVFQQIEKGNLKEDQLLSEDIETLNNDFGIDPDVAELTDGVVSFTVKDALKQMITISHNYAALLLTKQIKLSTVAQFLKDNGFYESSVGTNGDNPNTTASDMELFLDKLYHGKLANPENTQKMIDLLKGQQLNDKLPKNLPDNVVIAHKTGELDFFSHDAGIVYAPQGDYIIIVMSESNLPAAAEDRIAQVSLSVYNYFLIQNNK